jgi:hypothetical protein
MLLTADAARKHGHEYSPPHAPSSPTVNGSFLVQMPLSIIGSVLRRQTPSPSLVNHLEHAGPTSNAPDATTPQGHAMHILPDTPLASPTPSRPVSSGSSAVDDLPGHQRIAAGYTESGGAKRTSRSKTSYVCARPARPIDSKLHLRPKVLLQLHQLIPSQRPKPTYELVPFSLLPPRSTRRLAQTFNTRERLGPHDLLVVKAQAYGSADEETPPDDDWASSEVVGVISPAKGDKSTEICIDGRSRTCLMEVLSSAPRMTMA